MLLFKTVTEVFEEIGQESSRTRITEKLAFLFASGTADEAAHLAYLSLGSLLPPYKNMVWNLAEKNIINVLASLSGQDASLIQCMYAQEGDLGLTAQKILQHTHHVDKNALLLEEVYDALHQLALMTGIGSQDQKEQFLLHLCKEQDAAAIKYIIRIINGDLRLGFSDMTLLDAFSWSVVHSKKLKKILEHAYNFSADIGLIIKTLKKDGPVGIEKISVCPGIPIRPAAAERLAHAADIVKKLGPAVAQPKLDGLRVQIHIFMEQGGKKVAIFSRNLKDMSAMFPEVTQAAAALTDLPCIVEGEALAFDPVTNQMLPFQVTATRRRKHAVAQNAVDTPLRVVLFDILYFDHEVFVSHAHHERRAQLSKLLADESKKNGAVLTLIDEKKITDADQLSDYFEQCIIDGFEGLIVKKPDSLYQPGTRNFNWVKLKRQESDSLSDTLDCVIIGYYRGQGKRAHFGIGAFLVAVYNPEVNLFQTIAKIGTGLTDIEWAALKKLCDQHIVDHQLPSIDCPSELVPDVWITPSIVCSIRADEITLSPLHRAGKTEKMSGYALRFPRIMAYRPDKSATDATTAQEVVDLYQQQKQKTKLLGL
jgi:DNA ligase-1